ncbi:hypothetical protein [Neisseria sp. Ec49-e6-T10]|uniref:hypothetical protein n=1 Tax=Neisseria sp. Ec49-e6-T10 TaxID=3140744 RepID=UPI003EBC0582
MEKLLKLIDKKVSLEDFNFDGFSTSKGWVGYFERLNGYSSEIVQESVSMFDDYFGKYNNFFIMTALSFDDKTESDPEILAEYNDAFLFFIKNGILKTMSDSFESYLYGDSSLPISSLDFSFNYDHFIMLSKLMMSHSGIIGQVCFYINPELNIAVYPHDDTGFGCIALNNDRESSISFLKYCRNNSNFKIVIE